VPFLFLVELISKVLYLRGQMQLSELTGHVKLSVGVVDKILTFLRGEKLCESTRRGNSGTDADLCVALTDLGRARAAVYLQQNAYAGPAPVTLAAYTAQVKRQSVAGMHTTNVDIAQVLGGIVVDAAVLEQLGAAMNSGRAIFVHGPAGSGKTYLAERLHGLLKGTVLIPHAIMVDREVLPFYDNLVHEVVEEETADENGIGRNALNDGRWLRVKRPAVLVGGELTMGMLDVQFDPGSRMYHAPSHLKANNGIFIIDDLGRQRCSAVELMNRWIVPMDRRQDYLSLHTGYKFPVPFDMVIVFSSNYKILVDEITPEQYQQIFTTVCKDFGIAYDQASFNYLLREHHIKEERPLLACYPRDLLAQVRDLARYYRKEPKLDPETLSWAWNNYFTTHAKGESIRAAPAASGMFYERRNRANQGE
jgi:energy-coupling factor transporter ATP-binding protein EcfA2